VRLQLAHLGLPQRQLGRGYTALLVCDLHTCAHTVSGRKESGGEIRHLEACEQHVEQHAAALALMHISRDHEILG
jgi:hypothetical protein